MKLAFSAIGAGGLEKLEALVKIRGVVVSDETVRDTADRNEHPAFKAILGILNEVAEPDLYGDMEANDAGKYAGVLSASNLVGIVASLGGLLEDLKAAGKTEAEILSNADVKCIVSQCRHLAKI
jgi:hypothetical protein